MTTAASAEFGRSARSPLKNTSSSTTTPAPTTPASWLLAPDCSATAVRELLAEMANPRKKPAAMLAEPMPIISWFGFTCSPRRALNEVDRAMVSVSDTSVMPTAATSSGTTSPMSVHGTSGVGQPLGKGADRGDVEVEHGGDDGGADHRDEHGGDLAGDAREHEQHGERDEPDGEGRGVALVEVRHELPHLLDEGVGVRREPAELRQLPDDDDDGQSVHVADLDLAREQVGDEAELADTEPDLDEADQDGEHAGQGDGGGRVVAGHDERGDGGEDQRPERRVGAEHEDLRRPHEGVADEAGDRGVETVHRRQPGELGVRHALGDQDRRQDDPGHEVGAQPTPLVRAQRRDAGHVALHRRHPLVACPPIKRRRSIRRSPQQAHRRTAVGAPSVHDDLGVHGLAFGTIDAQMAQGDRRRPDCGARAGVRRRRKCAR